ncbi:UNKNOWN [Stylonychia lemnae]|uniref:Lebercilin domain-containing protein n=1 Tax=Stylonychia lemnae TaxID=5949 RepID=A0A078B515_STYLE|nr:UNKNOWN [Stylonychia lemnae]|eukprot:CDW89336.1 UNKNOWN [Stylonychia lemnae]
MTRIIILILAHQHLQMKNLLKLIQGNLLLDMKFHNREEINQLKKTNAVLKKKLKQLTLALDVSLNKTQSVHDQQINGGQNNNSQDYQALNDIIYQKDKEINLLRQTIEQQMNEIKGYKNKGYLPSGYDKILDLQAKLNNAEQKNTDLIKELKSMHKIQVEQGRALEKITDENDYPLRIKALVEEMRYSKERIRGLELKLRNEERTNKQQQEHMVRLEETIRELKGHSKKNQAIAEGGSKVEANKPYHLMKADEKIEELNRVVEMLTKAKEKDYKNFNFQKAKYEKQIKELLQKLEEQSKNISDKDKVNQWSVNLNYFQELKLQGFKLRQLMQEEYRQPFVKKNFEELDRLASPKVIKRADLEQGAQVKLDGRKEIYLKYGKLPLKPGFNKRKIDFKEKMALLDIEVYGSSNEQNRSRSVNPLSKQKYKRLNQTTLDMDNAADQIIENSLNQFKTEIDRERNQREDQDYLEQMYDNLGGKVFDINHDLNVNTISYVNQKAN